MDKEAPWRCCDPNHASDPEPPDIGQQKHVNQSMVFPNTYTSVNFLNPFCCARNSSSFFPGFAAQRYLDLNRPPYLPLNPSGYSATVTAVATATVTAQNPKRFLVFDQSGDQTNLVYSSVCSPFPAGKNVSDGTNVSDGPGGGEEEMHEDTEEIDALLYSDSEDHLQEEEEEEGSTGHTPVEMVTACSGGDVGSSSAMPMPTKRRRGLEYDDDGDDADTASSASRKRSYEWSCVGGGGEEGNDHRSKRVKMERIQETVGVLRRIIPGGRGKDAAGVLDEAIKYLKALRIKAKSLGTASFL